MSTTASKVFEKIIAEGLKEFRNKKKTATASDQDAFATKLREDLNEELVVSNPSAGFSGVGEQHYKVNKEGWIPSKEDNQEETLDLTLPPPFAFFTNGDALSEGYGALCASFETRDFSTGAPISPEALERRRPIYAHLYNATLPGIMNMLDNFKPETLATLVLLDEITTKAYGNDKNTKQVEKATLKKAATIDEKPATKERTATIVHPWGFLDVMLKAENARPAGEIAKILTKMLSRLEEAGQKSAVSSLIEQIVMYDCPSELQDKYKETLRNLFENKENLKCLNTNDMPPLYFSVLSERLSDTNTADTAKEESSSADNRRDTVEARTSLVVLTTVGRVRAGSFTGFIGEFTTELAELSAKEEGSKGELQEAAKGTKAHMTGTIKDTKEVATQPNNSGKEATGTAVNKS